MKRLAALAVVAVLASGCAPRYDTALLTSIEGRWMCDVQRYTFQHQEDIQAELDIRLEGNGVSPEQYHAFKDDLTKSEDLRQQVQAVYDEACGT
jgi:hypothetical protein